jgi:hypothetical protein
MLLNAVGAAGLFAFLGHLNPHLDPLVLMFLAGLGFPVVLRTNFTLIKGSVGDVQTEDIALKFSEVYDPLRDFCRDEINLAIMEKISESVTSLQQETNLSPVDLKQGLIKLARTTIAAHSLLSSDEKEAQRQEIDRLVDQFSKDPELQRLELCLLIIRNSSLEYLRKRLSHLRPPRPGITKEHVQQMLLPDKREQFLSNLSPERREHIQQYIQATMADDRLSEPLKEAYVAEMLLEAAGEQLDELL